MPSDRNVVIRLSGWARTLVLLHAEALDPELVRNTLNVILKFQEDIENVSPEISTLTSHAVKGPLPGRTSSKVRR